jgi:hypothetical protein
MKDRRLGAVFYSLQLTILAYIVGYVVVYRRGYLVELPVLGSSRLEVGVLVQQELFHMRA